MNRLFFWSVCCLSLFCILLSCNSGAEGEIYEGTFQLKGTLQCDSTLRAVNQLVLFTDNHRRLSYDTINVAPDGTFEFEGPVSGLSELYLCSDRGEYCRFYAGEDMQVSVTITASVAEGVAVSYKDQPTDTINAWLMEKASLFEEKNSAACCQEIEKLVDSNPSDIRNTILLRDQLAAIQDSLFVRQRLGSIQEVAKPEWLRKSIDAELSVLGLDKADRQNRRLKTVTFESPDTIIGLATSHSDYLLVCFWAENSPASIDSMRTFSRLVSSEYEGKRVSFLSCCLYAKDSAAWNLHTRSVDGMHTWVKGGFSDERMRAWNVTRMPSVILMDMYCNRTQKDVWGDRLRKALDRIPNRVGFQKKK